MSLLKRTGPASPEQQRWAEEQRRQIGEAQKISSLKVRVHTRLLADLDPALDAHSAKGRAAIKKQFSAILNEENQESIVLSRAQKTDWLGSIIDLFDYGPLGPLLADVDVTDIMVNTPRDIYMNRKGPLLRSELSFKDDKHLLTVLNRMLAIVGQRLDEAHPIVQVRLPGGAHVNAVIDPISALGPTIVIRKFKKQLLTVQNIIDYGSVTVPVMEFLRASVMARANIVVCGGDKAGKTSLLNALSGFIPEYRRIVTIEHDQELQLQHDQVISLFSRPPNNDGQGEVTLGDLIRNSLLMLPYYIVLGECRGGEALDLLQAMIRRYASLTTVQAASPRDALARLELMALMSGVNLPARAVRELIAFSVNLIVHIERLRDGKCKVMAVSEAQGMKGGAITLSNIFEFEQTGVKATGKILGSVQPTGLRPKILKEIEGWGIQLPPSIFERSADPPGG